MTQSNLKAKIFTILKWVLVVFFFFMLIGLLMDKAYLSALMFLLAILLVFPPLTNVWESKIPFLKNKWIKGVAVFVLFIVAFAISPDLEKYSNAENNTEKEIAPKQKEMKFDKKKKILVNYIETDTLNKSIQNIKYLEKVGNLFDVYSSSTSSPQDNITEYLDSTTQKKLLLFDAKYDFSGAESFLKADKKNGKINNYVILFDIDNEGNIVSTKTIITYSKTGKVEYLNNEVPDIKTLVDNSSVKGQEELKEVQRIASEKQQAYADKKAKFEKDCLSGWDGSDLKLVRYVKNSMNDPKSFEHVETRYKVMDDYAIVVMKFRGKNAFGGTVLNSVTAKVSLDDGSVIEIEN